MNIKTIIFVEIILMILFSGAVVSLLFEHKPINHVSINHNGGAK